MRWNHQNILDEIRHLHSTGEELCFSGAESSHPHVVRAALWHFGSWKKAVEVAGLDSQVSSKYRRWTRESVIAAIRAHHRAGHDLSWRAIATKIDPPLAAAARRSNVGFGSWEDALQAAGINPRKVVKYRRWTSESVLDELQLLAHKTGDLSASAMQRGHQGLYNAALRRFDSWGDALQAAGIDRREVGSCEFKAAPRKRRKATPKPDESPQIALCAEGYLSPELNQELVLEPIQEPDARLFEPSSEFDARELTARTNRMTATRGQLSDENAVGSRELNEI